MSEEIGNDFFRCLLRNCHEICRIGLNENGKETRGIMCEHFGVCQHYRYKLKMADKWGKT